MFRVEVEEEEVYTHYSLQTCDIRIPFAIKYRICVLGKSERVGIRACTTRKGCCNRAGGLFAKHCYLLANKRERMEEDLKFQLLYFPSKEI
jgi:hypothetical protein